MAQNKHKNSKIETLKFFGNLKKCLKLQKKFFNFENFLGCLIFFPERPKSERPQILRQKTSAVHTLNADWSHMIFPESIEQSSLNLLAVHHH